MTVERGHLSGYEQRTSSTSCVHFQAHFVPYFCFVCAIGGFIIGYIMAVSLDHEEAWLSMVSDGGAIPPESCIFGLMLNAGSCLWLLVSNLLHIRLYIALRFDKRQNLKYRIYATIMLAFGWLCFLGMCAVACIQESVQPHFSHSIGAQTCFFGGIVYLVMYMVLLRWARLKWTPRWITVLRIVLLVLVGINLVMYRICQAHGLGFLVNRVDGAIPERPDEPNNGVLRFKPGDAWHDNYVAACIFEWCMIIAYFAFIPTFACEFRQGLDLVPRSAHLSQHANEQEETAPLLTE